METSIALAMIFGTNFLVTGLSMLINPRFMRAMADDLSRSSISMLLVAVMGLALGSILVTIHNIWTHDWRVLITIICWLILIRGILHTLFPQQIMKYIQRIRTDKVFMISGIVMILMGIGFFYLSFQ